MDRKIGEKSFVAVEREAEIAFHRAWAEALELGLIETAVVDGQTMVWLTPKGEKWGRDD
jgi:hypothetical protein